MIKRGLKQEPYLIVNSIIAGIILSMLVYFGIFSSQGLVQPLPSMYDFEVPSTGLSRSFSSIMQFDFVQAKAYNPYGIHLLLFFIIQLFLRILFSILLLYKMFTKKVMLFIDIVLSLLLFLTTFGVYIVNQWHILYG